MELVSPANNVSSLPPSPEAIVGFHLPPPLDLSRLAAVPELPAEPPANLEESNGTPPRELLDRQSPEFELATITPCPIDPTPEPFVPSSRVDEPVEVVISEAGEQVSVTSSEPLEPTDTLESLLKPVELNAEVEM